ncbi:MAG: hypothetical protein M1819_001026 [Sarea resinae]|nr:MAG: hypothetical protein M1819_001026 [Sarea resinae]
MPPRASTKKRASDRYEADGGFVVDSPDDASDLGEEAAEQRPKRVKREDGGAGRTKEKGNGKGKGENAPDTGKGGEKKKKKRKDDEGNVYWELTRTKRITLSQFKGQTMVQVREYYESKDSGKWLPGKKGIALPLAQFSTLVELLPEIEAALVDMGLGAEVVRPEYGDASASGSGGERAGAGEEGPGGDEAGDADLEDRGAGNGAGGGTTGDDDADGGGDEDGEEDAPKAAARKRRESTPEEKKKRKRNFDATSDEDSG